MWLVYFKCWNQTTDAITHLGSKVWVLSPGVLSCLHFGGTSKVDQGVAFPGLREVCSGDQENKVFAEAGWSTVSNVTDCMR